MEFSLWVRRVIYKKGNGMTSVKGFVNTFGSTIGALVLAMGFNQEIVHYAVELTSGAPIERKQVDLNAKATAEAQETLVMKALEERDAVVQPDGTIVITIKGEDVRKKADETLNGYYQKIEITENFTRNAKYTGLGIFGGLAFFNLASLRRREERQNTKQNTDASDKPDVRM
jgi:hypothetical protein